MSRLSEESLLLIENWHTVEDILRAVERLQEELSALLHGVEAELAEEEWWSDGWFFVPHANDQVYISKESWKGKQSGLVWIGLERFRPTRLFGRTSPPRFYVWVLQKHPRLARSLAEAIERSDEETLGEIDQTKSPYVVKHLMRKCVPGETQGIEEEVRGQIVEFFAHYATLLSDFDGMIQEYRAGLG